MYYISFKPTLRKNACPYLLFKYETNRLICKQKSNQKEQNENKSGIHFKKIDYFHDKQNLSDCRTSSFF